MGAIVALIIIATPVTAQFSRTQPAITAPQSTANQLEKSFSNQQQLLEFSNQQQLREIPDNQDKPIRVATGVYVNNLVELDQSNETFEITGYLYSSWKDPRLSFNPKEKGFQQLTSYGVGDIWIPKLGLDNSEEFNNTDDYIGINADGTVQHIQTFEAKLSSRFFLEFFPFDSQRLLILVEPWNYTTSQVILEPDYAAMGISQESYSGLSEWRFKTLKTKIESVLFPPDKNYYSRLVVEIQIQRQFIFYIWNVFIPILFFNIIAWGAFWISPKNFGEQVAVSISAMLFLITFNFIVKAGLPRVPYLIFIDGIIFISYTSIFISLLSLVLVHYLIGIKKEEFALKLQTKLRFFIPLAFITCNLLLIGLLLTA
jgi:hypothetical protein